MKLYQEAPYLPMEKNSYKSQDNIGWDNMIQVWISLQCKKFQSEYIKEFSYRKTDLKCASSFI